MTQPRNLLFQDGCHHIQYATGCWRSLPTFYIRMDVNIFSMQPTYFEAHTPILLTKLLMQPAKLRFQDGCSQNHHPTYLLQSTHPKFVKPAADATHPTNLLFQDICPHSMQPADQSLISCNLQPAPCNLQPETYNLQPTTCTTTYNHIFQIGCFWNQHAAYLLWSAHPNILTCSLPNLPTIYLRLYASNSPWNFWTVSLRNLAT